MKYKLSKSFIVKSIIFRLLIFLFLYFILRFVDFNLEALNRLNGLRKVLDNIFIVLHFKVIVIFLISIIIYPILSYFTWSYFIFDDFIEIRCGVLFKKYICIKRDNIKYINVCENPIDAILKIKSINIYTAGGRVKIPAINKKQVESFNYMIQERV